MCSGRSCRSYRSPMVQEEKPSCKDRVGKQDMAVSVAAKIPGNPRERKQVLGTGLQNGLPLKQSVLCLHPAWCPAIV